jgi:putative thiamine transport system ATP-binding protein
MSLVLDRLCVAPKGGAPLFPPLSLEVAPGEVATIMGPSGIGKSTLLDAIGGHLSHAFGTSGRVILDGRDVTALPPEARQIGVLFQEALLFPHLSVGDNLAFALGPGVRGGAARRAAVEEALAQAGLAGFHDRDPATLSGGQKARAALFRTLLAEPKALLLDEPFSRLDAGLRDEIRRFVFARAAERAIPALLVTHDAADAQAARGQVVNLSGPG